MAAYNLDVKSIKLTIRAVVTDPSLIGPQGPKGDDAPQPFKGWFEAGATETSNLPSNPSVGDYAYVKTVDGEDNPITKVYDCVAAGVWHDSGRTVDTSNVQVFKTLQQVNEVSIVDDLITGGSNDVLSAEQGRTLRLQNGLFSCINGTTTVAKTVDATGFQLPVGGGSIKVKFTYANTASSPTLNIGNTGAKAILYNGAVASSANSWAAGDVVEFYYDPTYNSNAGAWIGRTMNTVNSLLENSSSNISSKAVYNALKRLDAGYNAIAVFKGTLTAYAWNTEPSYIPASSVVKNIGAVTVNLYVEHSSSASYKVCEPGAIIKTTEDYVRIRNGSVAGSFHILVYSDVSEYKDYENQFYFGNKKITLGNSSSSAWSVKNLPFAIKEHTHIRITTNGTDNTRQFLYLNRNLENEKYLTNFNGIWDLFAPVDIANIATQVTGISTIEILNDEQSINDNIVSTQSVQNDSITPDKIKGEHRISTNLYDKGSGHDGYYITSSGSISTNSSLSLSDYIPVKPSTYYKPSTTMNQYAWFDKEQHYISGGAATSSAIQSPDNAAYIRISVYVDGKNTFSFNEGQSVLTYEPYYHKVYNPNIITDVNEEQVGPIVEEVVGDNLGQITSRLWNGYKEEIAESLSNAIEINDYPRYLKQGDRLSFEALVTSWNDGIIIGKGIASEGGDDFTNAWAVIDSTEIKVQIYSGGVVTIGTLQHGLTIDTFVKVIIDITAKKWKFILQTLTDTYIGEVNCAYSRGCPSVKSNGNNGAIVSDVVFRVTNSYLQKPIWMLGDSYFGIGTTNRELYWLNEWGYLNTLVSGFGGESSAGGYSDLTKLLAISKPKYIVWAYGMNDDNASELEDITTSSWYSYLSQVMTLCEQNNITLILSTIPNVVSTSYKNKKLMTDYVKSSGYRYIDVAKAVGSQADGKWYGDGETYHYLDSTDNVHPTEYGAKAIASQFLIDFPEIMQY